jgi:peptide/nickel transport system permease protein
VFHYILRRIAISIPLLFAISFIAFMIIQMAPGNYFDQIRMNPQISEETVKNYEQKYHFDKNPVIQYGYWLINLAKLNLGYSFSQSASVWNVLKSRLLNTLLLSVSAMIFAWLLAIPMGVLCAVNRNKFLDRFFSGIAFIGLSIPNFFLALLLLYMASRAGILPVGGMMSAKHEDLSLFGKILDIGKHLILPTVVLGTSAMAGLLRLSRGNMLEVLGSPFITTARAKGLSETRVIGVHALKNALNPLITLFGYQLSGLLSGAALTEIICGWPGIGSIMLEAARKQDLFLLMGNILLAGVLLIIGNLIADLILAWIDPRIRYKGNVI